MCVAHAACLTLSSPCGIPAAPLQHQAKVLVERLGMDPGLSHVLRELWLAFLAQSRLLEPGTMT